jgi:class 3 adenylate cyclase
MKRLGQTYMNDTRRKLTTIFSADVQDYSKMMGADEEGTLATLKRYRDAMAAVIVAHDGRVINTWGDGLIAEFPSVVEAVRAAVDTQNELAGYNAKSPAGKQMLYRIGINLGDVIEVGDDIYGDGVNIAARLQTSASPGGIVISSTVYDQVRNKLTVGFDFLGDLSVKNINEAVPSYAVRVGSAAAAPEGPRVAEPPKARAVPPTYDNLVPAPGNRRLGGLYLVAGIGLAAINVLTWHGEFWAKWPILALAFLAAMQWTRTQRMADRRMMALAVLAAGIVCINLMTWHGVFWAAWPLLAFAFVFALRWLKLRR